MTAREALALGTLHGARCLGREDELGTLEPGKLADIVLWRPRRPRPRRHRRPGRGAGLRRRARSRDRVLVGGRDVVEDGELLTGDADEIARRRSPPRLGGGARMSTITAIRDGVGESRPPAGRHPEGQGRVRLLVGHVGRGHAVGRDAALARTRARGSAAIEHRRGARRAGRARRAHPRGRARAARRTGSSTTTSRCWRSTRSATRASRWRSSPPTIPRPRAARPIAIEVDYEELEPLTDPEYALDPSLRRCTRRATCSATSTSRTATEPRRGRRRGQRRVRGRDAGPGVPRARVRARGAGRGRRRRPVHLDPVAARRPRPGGGLAWTCRVDKVRLHARGRRRRVRRARGRLDADPRLPARAAHRPAGEDGLRARGVVLRPRPPPPGADALRARRDARRPAALHQGAGSCSTAARTPRRSTAVCSNAASFALGPYAVPSARIDSYVVYTDNPPCGAMRGFGAVQTCFAHEAQMDKLAAALGMDPVELRLRNAMADRHADAHRRADQLPRAGGRAARVGARPAAARRRRGGAARRASPTSPAARACVRGVGYAVGFKNVGFSEGFDDYSTARVRLSVAGGEPLVEVHTAAAEVGQGLVTVMGQIARHRARRRERARAARRHAGRLRRARRRPRARRT